MKKIFVILIIAFAGGYNLFSQRITGIILPGEEIINNTGDSLYYLSISKLRLLLDSYERLELTQKIIQNLEKQMELNRQLIRNKADEVLYWKQELDRLDKEMEQAQIQYEYLEAKREKARKMRKWWFAGGVVVGVVVCSLPHP